MYSFALDKDETKRYSTWLSKHDKTCRYANIENQGAIGGRMTFSFTPTGIGTVVIAKCTCGEEINLTDYSIW